MATRITERDEDYPSSIEILRDRIYFVSLRVQPRVFANAHFFTVDSEFVYESFFADFGPLNLSHVYNFCNLLDRKLADGRLQKKRVYLYTSFDACKRTNAAFLICAYSVIRLGRSPEEAYRPFENIYPAFLPFRDASVGLSTYNLSILDCLRSLQKAIHHSFFDIEKFNLEEYQFYERVENGDLNWIVPNKFLAFCGPSAVFSAEPGCRTFTPEDYVPLFKKYGVSAVVRLNKKEYDRTSFTTNGIGHFDLYFMDGSAPSESILRRFLEIAEAQSGVVAVHCKAGLGRTGTLIAAYIMKHYRFSAAEAIAWLRICRPGSVIGPQQHFLHELQPRLWKQGEISRKKKAIVPPAKTSSSFEEGVSTAVKSMTITSPPRTTSNVIQSQSISPYSSYNTYHLRQRPATMATSTTTGYNYSKAIAKPTPIKRVKYPSNVAVVRSALASPPISNSSSVSSISSVSVSSVKTRQVAPPASRVSTKRYSTIGNISGLSLQRTGSSGTSLSSSPLTMDRRK